MNVKQNLLKPQNIFLILCLFYGTIFLLINPPFQAPDEDAHMFKMYGFTIGSVTMKKENSHSGQVLPKSLINIYKYYDVMKLKNEMKTSFKELDLISEIKLEKESTAFLRYIPAWYTPLSYFPSFVVLWVLKILNATPLTMIYVLRFCSLFVYLALMYAAIAITPVKKWLFFTVALLPLCVYQAGAISTDSLTLGLGFLWIAYTLKLALSDDESKISSKQICLWGLLFIYLCICKYAYFPFGIIYFLLPESKFENKEIYYKSFWIINLLNLLLIALFLGFNFYATQGAITELTQKTADKSLVIKGILKHPFEYLYNVLNSTVALSGFYYKNMISSFGWTSVMVPDYVTNPYYLLILSSLFYEDKKNTVLLTAKDRWIVLTGIVLSYFVIITSVFLLYQKYPIISGIQGRYLTLLLLLLCLVLSFKKFQTNIKAIPAILVVIPNLLMFVAVLTLISRFY